MPYTLLEKMDLIKAELKKPQASKDPLSIAHSLMRKDFVSMHGPEHHMLDGGSFLVAYKNAGGEVDLPSALDELERRAIQMPGATCGQWGVCGSVSSLGAALAIIHHTGPLSDDEFYKDNMRFTSSVLKKMAEIGGPRCCKRNATLSLSTAISFVKEHYGIEMGTSSLECSFYPLNNTCLKGKCPFHPRAK
jgi:hypothetical protein